MLHVTKQQRLIKLIKR